MIFPASEAKRKTVENCHGGVGTLVCIERFAHYRRPDAGITYVHDDLLPPGTSIGEHTHEGDEEVYLILNGEGEMLIDGTPVRVGCGDVCITGSGHRHALHNTGSEPMRLIVICAKTTENSA